MKRNYVVRRFVASLALLLMPYAHAGRMVRAVSAERFRLLHDYLIIVPVSVNGEGPFNFLLDTGTNTTLIDDELAAQLGLRPFERVSLDTIAGTRVVPRVELSSLTLAGKTLDGLEALCVDLRSVRSIDAQIRGVVGWNFLSEFNFLLDYAERRVTLGDGREGDLLRPLGLKFPIDVEDGRPLVRVRVPPFRETAAARLRLIIDSAVPRLALYGRAAPALDDGRREGLWVEVSTAVGNGDVRGGVVKSLQVGDETFRHLPVLLVSRGAEDEPLAADGLLPTSLFRSIYFGKEGFVILNPRF